MSRQIVSLLLQYEEALAALYAACATGFPETKPLFDELAAEETNHAAAIRELMTKVDDETIFLDGSRYKMRPLAISLEYVVDVNRRVEAGGMTLVEVLSSAHHIEVSVIEADYYKIFGGNSAYLNHYLGELQEESKNHRDKVLDALNRLRQQ